MDDHKSFWDDISFHSYPDSFTYWGDSNYLCFARNTKQILQHDGTSRDSLQQQSEETTNSEEQAANDGTRNMSKVQPKDVESVGATTASKEVNTAVDMLSSLSIHAEPVPSNRIRPLRKKKLPNKYSDFLMQNHYH